MDSIRSSCSVLRPLALVTLLSACAHGGPTVAEFEAAVSDWAGKGAFNCGRLPISAPRAAAIRCAAESLDKGRPFYLIADVQGIDSRVIQGIAGRSAGAPRAFSFDGGIGGRWSRMTSHPCPDPRFRSKGPLVDCR